MGWNIQDLWGGGGGSNTGSPQINTAGVNPAGGAGMGGADNQGQQQTTGLLQTMAAGGGPNAGQAVANQGVAQGQQLAQAQAGSARGTMGLANAQHDAMTAGVANTQQGAMTGAVLGAQQQQQAVGNLMQNQQNQRVGDLQAQGMTLQQAMAQAAMEQSTMQGNQASAGNAFGQGLGFVSSMYGGAAKAAAG